MSIPAGSVIFKGYNTVTVFRKVISAHKRDFGPRASVTIQSTTMNVFFSISKLEVGRYMDLSAAA